MIVNIENVDKSDIISNDRNKYCKEIVKVNVFYVK